MQGKTDSQDTMFVMINVEASIPQDHPLRSIKQRCGKVLKDMSKDFAKAYSKTGRPSIPPEQLLKALLLQALYSIRSEIQLMQSIQFNLMYRWFLNIPGDYVNRPGQRKYSVSTVSVLPNMVWFANSSRQLYRML